MNPGESQDYKRLIGTDEATIDDKGRILVSKKKRERLGEEFVIGLGMAGCLVAYTNRAWNRLVDEIDQCESINFGGEQFSRLIMGTAEDELKFDAQGRVVIPMKLRELAKLRKNVVLVGNNDKLEIWAAEEWEVFNRDPDSYGLQRRETIERAHLQMTGRLPR